MALCRFEAKIISRSGGRSTVGSASYRTGKCATSAAAYRAGAELTDERTGQTFDYTRKRGVEGAEIMLPAGAPDWMRDRGQLWNAVEKAEKRADAQLARDYILTLPHELDPEQRRALTREFVQREFTDKGYVADIAWHAPHGKGDERNHHAHVMVVMRRIEGEGFARTKERPPDGKHPAEHWKNELRTWREAWANTGADALAAAGFEKEAVRFRLGHLTLDKQREAAIARGDHDWADTLDRDAEPKQGPLATKIEREGRESHAGNDRRDTKARNAERARLRDEHAQVSAEIIDLEQERRKRQGATRMDDQPDNVPTSAPTDEKKRAQAVRQATAYKEAERAEKEQSQEFSARQLREKAQHDAEDARKNARERRDADERRAAEGEPTDARSRYAQALGAHFSARDPYGSLADAAMAEYTAFNRQQQEMKAAAEAEKDPEKRRVIELRREIEAHDYMAITSERLAGISRAITMSDNPSAQRDDERARVHAGRVSELRGQLAELRTEIRQRDANENQRGARDEQRAQGRDIAGQAGQDGTGQAAAPDNRQTGQQQTRSHREEAGHHAPGLDPQPQPQGAITARDPGQDASAPAASSPTRPEPEIPSGHIGQEGARRTGNPGHLQTRVQREEAERRAAGADNRLQPREARTARDPNQNDAGRQQREEADKRSGLRPDEAAEGRPATREGREEAERTAAPVIARTADAPRGNAREAGRPAGRGGGGRGGR